MAAERNGHTSASADAPAPTRTRRRTWVPRALGRVALIVLVIQVSFEVMLRSDWFTANPQLATGLLATVLVFLPAGVWAVIDGYRWAPTRQVVILWAVVAAGVAIVNHVYGSMMGLWGYALELPLEVVAQIVTPLLPLAVMHAAPAALLVLLGAGLHRYRDSGIAS
ncbi:hypothetical protein RF644_17865 [Kocuria sp. CPCC 205258]|uniref:hypothetical protein n=1 Tax=Kocuria sp. CPCC 205258 TaxID=3073552 RepID=UPI0034D748A2